MACRRTAQTIFHDANMTLPHPERPDPTPRSTNLAVWVAALALAALATAASLRPFYDGGGGRGNSGRAAGTVGKPVPGVSLESAGPASEKLPDTKSLASPAAEDPSAAHAATVSTPAPARRLKESAFYLPLIFRPVRSVGEMVPVPAGEALMGCSGPAGAACPLDEGPQHTVWLESYWIDKHEVSNGEYSACVAAGSCTPPHFPYSRTRPSYYGNPQYASYPVIFVDWYQAAAYCTWAGKRLPTEAEWEKAARGPSGWLYPWGDGPAGCEVANLDFCTGDTSEAGSYPEGASSYGAMDMAGNVWEWVADWYQPWYYVRTPPENPAGPDIGTHKLIRGGSWFHGAGPARSSYRFEIEPGRWASYGLGFRCARP
jgi:formylglycine-generating enzyme required for sulfatase activity